MSKQTIHTDDAPKAIGTYSQAVRCGDTVYLAGQIALDPATMQMVDGIEAQIHRVFKNLQAVAVAAGTSSVSTPAATPSIPMATSGQTLRPEPRACHAVISSTTPSASAHAPHSSASDSPAATG